MSPCKFAVPLSTAAGYDVRLLMHDPAADQYPLLGVVRTSDSAVWFQTRWTVGGLAEGVASRGLDLLRTFAGSPHTTIEEIVEDLMPPEPADGRKPVVTLHSGRLFDFASLDESAVLVEDVCWHLSHICRFTGACNWFYSVCQHSVHVADMLAPIGLAYEGLMHDAPEFVMFDMAKPVKNIMPDYRRMEKRVERRALTQLGVRYPLPAEVHEADHRMFVTERMQIMPSGVARVNAEWDAGYKPYEFRIPIWSVEEARRQFMAAYAKYRPDSQPDIDYGDLEWE